MGFAFICCLCYTQKDWLICKRVFYRPVVKDQYDFSFFEPYIYLCIYEEEIRRDIDHNFFYHCNFFTHTLHILFHITWPLSSSEEPVDVLGGLPASDSTIRYPPPLPPDQRATDNVEQAWIPSSVEFRWSWPLALIVCPAEPSSLITVVLHCCAECVCERFRYWTWMVSTKK